MLYTDDISDILKRDKRTRQTFRGVFASDELPQHSPTSSLYVCNTDPSTKGGEHWIVIYIDVKRRGELFDSAGCMRSIEIPFKHFMTSNCVSWTRNAKTVQNPLSDACGYHCIFYSVYRCLGYNMTSILNMYTAKLTYNDEIVKEFVCDLE